MRHREMRRNITVRVAQLTGPATLREFSGLTGTIAAMDGRLALVRFEDGRQQWFSPEVLAEATAEPVTPQRQGPQPAPPGPLSEVEALKQRVARIARKYAKEHDWCSEVDAALREMGIEPENEGTMKVSFEVPVHEVNYHIDEDMSLTSRTDVWTALLDLMEDDDAHDKAEEWKFQYEIVGAPADGTATSGK